ncbi:hypothetical protein [Rodentibacter pneumotropicus]|nr:hypothetical protein [Rodentibacter pneumotropicus]
MASHFNEKTRVQVPAVGHLFRFGYQFFSLKQADWGVSNNIFTDIF